MRIVIDTNVILDFLHFADPVATPILACIEAGAVRWISDPACRTEFARVLAYPAFAIDTETAARMLARHDALTEPLADAAESLDLPPLPRCRDADDQKFLVLAQRAAADLLISRDKEVLRLARRVTGFRIVAPAAARELLGPLV